MYYYKVLRHCLKMRHKLLDSARDLQLGSALPPQPPNTTSPTSMKRKIDRVSLEKRVKHRYFQELISIKKEIGDSSDSSFDENYPGELVILEPKTVPYLLAALLASCKTSDGYCW